MSSTIQHHPLSLTRKRYTHKYRKTKRKARVSLATKKRAGSIVKPKEVEPTMNGEYMITTYAKCHRVYSTEKNASYRNQFVRAFKKTDTLQSGHIVTCTKTYDKTPIIQISYKTKAGEDVEGRYINYKNKSGTLCFLTKIPEITRDAVLYLVKTSKIYSDETCTKVCGSLPKNKPVKILQIISNTNDATRTITRIAYYMFNTEKYCYLECKTSSSCAVYEGANPTSDFVIESKKFNGTLKSNIQYAVRLLLPKYPSLK